MLLVIIMFMPMLNMLSETREYINMYNKIMFYVIILMILICRTRYQHHFLPVSFVNLSFTLSFPDVKRFLVTTATYIVMFSLCYLFNSPTDQLDTYIKNLERVLDAIEFFNQNNPSCMELSNLVFNVVKCSLTELAF